VSFSVNRGEPFAIVGESGCGKTTLARMLLRLIEPDGGELRFEGRDLLKLRGEELRAQRRQMHMVFQDPFASLDPRMRVGEIVVEPLAIHEPGLSAAEYRSCRAPERLFSIPFFSCFGPFHFQLSTVNFFSSALECPR